jgi:hypothetical protein
VANHPQIEVKRIERAGELYVVTRSLVRAEKERAMRQRVLKGLRKDLAKLSHTVRSGRVRRKELIYIRLERLAERWPSAWSYLKDVTLTESELVWRWDRKQLRSALFQQGSYLLRTKLISRSTTQKNSGTNTCS